MAYHRTGNRLLLCVAVAAISFTCSNSALANQSLVFEEILITATKQPKGLQKVPITVTVLSKGVLDKYDVFTTQDLENNLPGFTMDKLGTNAARFAIRGSGSDNTSPGQEFSTALYQDGIYASTNSIAAMPLYDIERIEVLKGPQGTLWGKNSIGGN
ncbi:MAG: Plug domain-containing protein, partial [Exilibacterium sp.]